MKNRIDGDFSADYEMEEGPMKKSHVNPPAKFSIKAMNSMSIINISKKASSGNYDSGNLAAIRTGNAAKI